MTATTADLLRLAPTAIRAGREDFPTDPGRARIAATKYLRTACTPDGGPMPGLRETMAAVNAALAQQTTIADLDRYRQPNPDWFKGWTYQFPNGITVSITVWVHQVGTFELLSSDRPVGVVYAVMPDDRSGGCAQCGGVTLVEHVANINAGFVAAHAFGGVPQG